jgi:hypothetical protein
LKSACSSLRLEKNRLLRKREDSEVILDLVLWKEENEERARCEPSSWRLISLYRDETV